LSGSELVGDETEEVVVTVVILPGPRHSVADPRITPGYTHRRTVPTGATGEWHAASGRSDGWQEWSIDLSDYVGSQVEVSISYASDWGAQGIGAWLDDVTVSGGATESFEVGLGEWVVSGAPSGSAANPNDWARTTDVGYEEGAIMAMSPDNAAFRTVYFGFGLEGVTSAAERNDLMGRALAYLQ
jgi:hypothetical protein